MTDPLANVERLLMLKIEDSEAMWAGDSGLRDEPAREAVRLLLDVARHAIEMEDADGAVAADADLLAFARSLGGDPR